MTEQDKAQKYAQEATIEMQKMMRMYSKTISYISKLDKLGSDTTDLKVKMTENISRMKHFIQTNYRNNT